MTGPIHPAVSLHSPPRTSHESALHANPFERQPRPSFDPRRTPIHPIRSDPSDFLRISIYDRFRLAAIPFDRTEEDVILAHTVGFSVTEK